MVDQNFKSFRSVKKPILKSFHIIARLNFCKQFVTKPEGFWNNWIFSDETRICCNGSDRPPLVRRKPGSSCLNEKFIRPTTKFPLSIMVWGCISRKGLGSLFIIEGSVTSEVYIKIIDQSLLPTIHKYYNGEEIVFQQDNAPSHTAKKTKEFMQNKGINAITWPSNSPDLNPIENLWSFMKTQINKKNPSNKAELIRYAKEVWENEIPIDCIQTLIDSMPKRMQECIENKGSDTH